MIISGLKSTAIHGDREQRERDEALKGFTAGKYSVLVATNVAARLVINNERID